MKKTTTYLLLTFLLVSFLAKAQNNFQNQVTISGQFTPPPIQYEILKVIANGTGKPLRNVSFNVTADQTLRNGYNAGKYTFAVINKPLVLKGDVYYRGIDITENLIPASVSFTLNISAYHFTKDFQLSTKVNSGKPEDVSSVLPDTTGKTYEFNIINYKLIYSSNDVSNLQRKAELINDYYKKTFILDQQFLTLQAIDPYDYSVFRTIFQRLDAAQKIADDISAANYENLLQLNDNDPARLTEKLNAYRGLLEAKKEEATKVFGTLHLVFHSRGNDAMRDGNNNAAYDLYHNALELNPSFAPSMLQLARIDFIRRDFKEAQCKSEEILYRMLPDPATRSNTVDLLENIQGIYIDQGKTFNIYKQYENAIEQYIMAKDICKRFPQIRCTNELYMGLETAHRGIYSNHLNDARAAVQRNDFSNAEKITTEAIQYWKSNLKLIGEPNEAYDVQKLIRQRKYDNLVLFGKQLNDQRDYEKAVNKFMEADNLQQLYALSIASDYAKQSKIAAKNFASQLIIDGENAVKVNDLVIAKTKLNISNDLQSRFYLQNDSILTKRSDVLREKIYGQECINAQFSIDSATAAGRLAVKEKDYLKAYKVLLAGADIKKRNPTCKLFTDSVESLLSKIQAAGYYLDLMETVKGNISEGNYYQAINDYISAGDYFKSHNVVSFNLQHNLDRDDYVLNQNNLGLLNYISEKDMKDGNIDNSLRLYKILVSKNFDIKFIEDSLYQLGYKTGKRDHIIAPGGRVKKLAGRYTQGDKRLKRFEKGFAKGYR